MNKHIGKTGEYDSKENKGGKQTNNITSLPVLLHSLICSCGFQREESVKKRIH